MRRSFSGMLSILRYAAAAFFVMGVLQQQWQPVFWFFLLAWAFFIVQIKWGVQSSDADLRQLLDGVQYSLPTTVLGVYFSSHHNWWLGGSLFGCLGVTLVLIRVLRRVNKTNPRLRWYLAWSWIVLWQGGLAGVLGWLAFS